MEDFTLQDLSETEASYDDAPTSRVRPILQSDPVPGKCVVVGGEYYANAFAAIGSLTCAHNHTPRDAGVLARLAEAHALGGAPEAAIESLERAIVIAPDGAYYLRLAQILARSKRTGAAEALLDRLSSAARKDPQAAAVVSACYSEIAAQHFGSLDVGGATEAFRKSAAMATGRSGPLVRLTLCQHIATTLGRVLDVVEPASNETSDCHAAVVVWGAQYAKFFVDTCLPSLLAAGNLPYLAARMRLLFTIHADEAAIAVIDASPAFAALRQVCETLFIEIPENILSLTRDPNAPPDVRYRQTLQVSSAHHDIAARIAADKGAALLYVVPDWVVSENCFKAMIESMEGGKEIAVFPVVICDRQALTREISDGGATTISLPEDTLATLAVKHMHQSWSQFAGGDGQVYARQFPAWLWWRFGETGLVLHAYHWTTAYVSARGMARHKGKWFWTIDHRFLDAVLETEDDFSLVASCRDTERAIIVAVAEDGVDYAWAAPQNSLWDIGRMAAAASATGDAASNTRMNHRLLCQRVVLNGGRESDGLLAAVEKADDLIGALAECIGDVGYPRY